MILDVITWTDDNSDILKLLNDDIPMNSYVSDIVEDMFDTIIEKRCRFSCSTNR